MDNQEYKYYLLKDKYLARQKKEASNLSDKEFYLNGEWKYDKKLNLSLNDCIMDFGDSRWYEYDEISEIDALTFIERGKC